MPEKQEVRVGMGAVSASESKYELEGRGAHPVTGSGRPRGGGRGLAPPFPTAAWGTKRPHSREAAGAQCSTPCPVPPTMVTSPFSFPSGIPKPTVRTTTSGNPSWVVRGFPPLRSQEWKGLAMPELQPERQGPHCQSHRTLRGPAAADRHPSKVGGWQNQDVGDAKEEKPSSTVASL